MQGGNLHPDENRERLANTNNSWTYPSKLDSTLEPFAHPTKSVVESEKMIAEKEDAALKANAAKTADKAADAEEKAVGAKEWNLKWDENFLTYNMFYLSFL